MLGRADILRLIPHQGAMCLLDSVREWNTQSITCTTHTHREPSNPLRSSQGLRAIHLCEYGAQAMAMHGALLGQGAAAPGVLAALRDVQVHRDFIHDLPNELIIEAHCLHADATLLQYEFRALHGAELLSRGRATVVLQLVGGVAAGK